MEPMRDWSPATVLVFLSPPRNVPPHTIAPGRHERITPPSQNDRPVSRNGAPGITNSIGGGIARQAAALDTIAGVLCPPGRNHHRPRGIPSGWSRVVLLAEEATA